VGTLIFQDLCVVPMVLIVPLLGSGQGGRRAVRRWAWRSARRRLVVVGTVLVARWWCRGAGLGRREPQPRGVPARDPGDLHRHRLADLAGRALARARGLPGGMVVADTEYGHRAMGDILPLRDAFVSMFFVSLGMLFDDRVVLENPCWCGLLAGFLIAKGALATFAA
jgi:CPA2 family monovalent cation:H+ antiporter-2